MAARSDIVRGNRHHFVYCAAIAFTSCAMRARLLLALFVVLLAFTAQAQALTVFAAASLKEALDAIADAYGAQQPPRPVVAYAASSALARQIESGAPADVFISADQDWVDYLAQKHLLVPGTRRDLVHNELVLVAPARTPVTLAPVPGFALRAALHGGRLALADPGAVPAGRYARAALEKLGVWHDVAGQIASAENVRAALALVARGEAPLGIVYATDARAEPRVMVAGTFPADAHPPIVYPAALVKGAQAGAQRFLDFLGSDAARAIFVHNGFVPAGSAARR
jgi:molybdate transport system substrate-binding protein